MSVTKAHGVAASVLSAVVLSLLWGTVDLNGLRAAPDQTQLGQAQRSAASDALQVLTTNCGGCHGSTLASPEAGFGFIDNLERLAANRDYVVKGNPDASYIVTRIQVEKSMPPGQRKLTPVEVQAVRTWILSLVPATTTRPFISDEAILQAIAADLRTADPQRRRTFRYLTLTNLFNSGVDTTALNRFTVGLSKLLNSLSWSPTIYRPVAVDANKTIYRVDLAAIQGPDGRAWTPQRWEAILSRPYPYGINYDTELSREVSSMTGTSVPFVRADWFSFEATQQPLYNQLLGLPTTVRVLESQLGVDVSANILAGRAIRAGFVKSGVSNNNRLIERHQVGKWTGAYWRSYDFRGSNGAKELLSHPLGPLALAPSHVASAAFEHDGGEIIFSLPNGLQAYMLIDDAGNRIETGPQDVVFDKLNSSPNRRGVIVNAVSCIACHAGGMNPAKDEVRRYAAGAATPRVREIVNLLYSDDAGLQAQLNADTKRFRDASRLAGIGEAEFDPVNEPVVALAKRFQERLHVPEAAAEVGVPQTSFLERIGGQDLLDIKLQLQSPSGVARDEFIGKFEALVLGLRLGEPLLRAPVNNGGRGRGGAPGAAPPPPAAAPLAPLAGINGTWFFAGTSDLPASGDPRCTGAVLANSATLALGASLDGFQVTGQYTNRTRYHGKYPCSGPSPSEDAILTGTITFEAAGNSLRALLRNVRCTGAGCVRYTTTDVEAVVTREGNALSLHWPDGFVHTYKPGAAPALSTEQRVTFYIEPSRTPLNGNFTLEIDGDYAGTVDNDGSDSTTARLAPGDHSYRLDDIDVYDRNDDLISKGGFCEGKFWAPPGKTDFTVILELSGNGRTGRISCVIDVR